MKRIKVFPNKNSILRDTDGNLVPITGKTVPLNTYWSRRIKAGDCTVKEEKKTDSSNSSSASSGSSKNSESTKKSN